MAVMHFITEPGKTACNKNTGVGSPEPEDTTCKLCSNTWRYRDAMGLIGAPVHAELPLKTSGSSLDIQIGGDHYKSCKIQPIEYIEANDIKFLEGCAIKRLTRHDKPTGKGVQDIDKAIHELQLIKELRYGNN